MAAGTVTIFDEFTTALNKGVHQIGTHVFKCMFIDATTVPTAGTATPVKADFTEVSGGNFPAGGTTVTLTESEAGGVSTVDCTTNISLASNGSNPADVRYGVLYNDTSAGDQCVAFVEISTTGHDAQGGATGVTWGANLYTLTRT